MRYTAEQKVETRKRISDASARCFRSNGLNGIGIDGLAKEAGVTSGAFYKHFPSKLAAFEEAMIGGMQEVQEAVSLFQSNNADWWPEFARFYLQEKSTCEGSQSCGLQSLTPDVGRADPQIKSAFEAQLRELVQQMNPGENNAIPPDTWAKLAILMGGVTLARAVNSPALQQEIIQAIQQTPLCRQQK
ncbi:TetR/AcrR family transcriptional regulator [Bowmanella denitrificans]|uniref:TetR/AcrR family transcriptional regulator n=1 Tax=Bowmanella denitrificans TaxID=366582 RepID=UPI000C9A65F7|nr:TetR/AcrR family transcriptional regulator [Bowmanella denitrificans]